MKTLHRVLIAVCISCFAGSACFAQDPAQNQDKEPKAPRKQNTKLIELLPGTWKVTRVYEGKKEITPADSLVGEQFTFDFQGRYKNLAGKEVIGEGSYRVSESTALLYLESDNNYASSKGRNQDTWKISIKDNVLTMQAQGNKEAKRFRYVYVKQVESAANK
jgi:hypothetical protein